jgi:hypothetical protein
MAALRGGHPAKHGYSGFPYWMAGSSLVKPGHEGGAKFALDSMISFLSGNIWLIKFGDDALKLRAY